MENKYNNPPRHPAARMATRIVEKIEKQRLRERAAKAARAAEWMRHHAEAVIQDAGRIEKIMERGWALATAAVIKRLGRGIENLSGYYGDLPAGDPGEVMHRNVCDELAALPREFDDVVIDLRAGDISATTEPVTLEGVALGRFTITLAVDDDCYDVIALEPNPPLENGNCTHPHVRHGKLCAGEGEKMIHDALKHGCILDFFQIVSRILMSYNPDSAYVQLEDWDREALAACDDCGTECDADNINRCDGDACARLVCTDCDISCRTCHDSFCGECITKCDACDHFVCKDCMIACADCSGDFCPACVVDGRCAECKKEHEEEEEEEKENNDESETGKHSSEGNQQDPPVQSSGTGVGAAAA